MQGEPIRVLVVDDDEDDAFLICDAIEGIDDGDHEIVVKYKAEDGLAALIDRSFDVVFCDYRLGATSGIDFIRNVRSTGDETPIILLTGNGEKAIDEAALAAGAADFAAKISITAESLDRSMRYAIANASRQRLLTAVLNNANAAVVVLDDKRNPKLWNPAWSDLAEHVSDHDEPLHESAAKLAHLVMEHDEDDLKIRDRIVDRHFSKVGSDETVVVLHDVTERVQAFQEQKAAEKRIAHMAMHDTLTGLPNRAAFENMLAEEVEYAKATGSKFYLMNLDLNRFKEVNDVFGHKVGDGLLIEVTNRLQNCLKETDFIARVGGDEFIALQRCDADEADVPQLAERFIDSITETFEIDGKLVRSGVSIGVSVYPDHGQEAELLLSNADAAM